MKHFSKNCGGAASDGCEEVPREPVGKQTRHGSEEKHGRGSDGQRHKYIQRWFLRFGSVSVRQGLELSS